MKNKQLPDKMSDLLRLAVKDAIKLSQSPKFKLDMNYWALFKNYDTYKNNKQCVVCMAGSVMVNTLKASVKDLDYDECEVSPRRYETNTKTKLMRINTWREGVTDFALIDKYEDNQNILIKIEEARKVIVNTFDMNLDGGRAPWISYFRAANILESVGL